MKKQMPHNKSTGVKDSLSPASVPVSKPMEIPIPLPVERAVRKLGQDVSLARRRRGMSQKSLAWRIGASESTMRRLEKGDPRIPLEYLARAMHVFGEIDRLSELIDTARDDIGLTLMDESLPKRIRTRKPSPQGGSL